MAPSLFTRLVAAVLWLAVAACPTPGRAAQSVSDSARVAAAQDLVSRLDLDNTDYAHGPGSVSWTGVLASHTDCSGFIDQLLMHVDGYSPDDFKRWFGSRRPTAERYHDAIIEGRGLVELSSVSQLRPGDVIAIKYLTRHDNTGHIMLVVEPAQRMSPAYPVVDGTSQWAISVIDSSESGHGPTDTRHKRATNGRDHEGLGRGVFRLYAGAQGNVVGFSWSTVKVSRFVGPQDEHVALGRFIPGFQP
jgi:NlpC/P60 family